MLHILDGVVDFHGQNLCTALMYIIFALGTLIGTFLGHKHQDFKYTLNIIGITTAICALVCTPGWPIYCRNQIKWKSVKHRD